ncbi:MAG: energy transducer TonB [Chitinophagales bacterium]|nr:energy transducer TonB [Bacteroidota bacterium]MCB9043819.1 energy transducer TonB [Chitinophagales bacterium]
MKKYVPFTITKISLWTWVLCMFCSAPVIAQGNTPSDDDYGIVLALEPMPEFPGGVSEMFAHLYKNINYPKEAIEKKIEGLVIVSFMVNEDGSLSDYKIVKDIGGGCGEEMLRVVKTFPHFIPAKEGENPIKKEFNLPFRLKLPEDHTTTDKTTPANETLTKEEPKDFVPLNQRPKTKKEQPQDTTEPKEMFVVVEKMPEFPGGQTAMMDYVYENIKYPTLAEQNHIEGLVLITFVVNEDGSLSDFVIKKDIGFGCGEEALRVIKTLPKFTPGMQRGKPVKVQYNLPIRFKEGMK